MLLIIIGAILVVFLCKKMLMLMFYQHWKKKGAPYVQPQLYFGNMLPTVFQKQPFPCFLQDLYNVYPEKRYVGLYEFSTPILMLRDPQLIKQISINDFETFSDRQPFLPPDVDPFWNRNLLALSGRKWRGMRSTLSPAFANSKMRMIYDLVNESAKAFTRHFLENNDTGVVEMKDVFSRFTNDVMASAIFGVKCDSLENGDNEFYLTVKQASNWGGIKRLKLYGYALCPTLMRILKLSFFEERVKRFFHEVVTKTMEIREKSKIVRPDMIHLLMEAQKGRLKCDDPHSDELPKLSSYQEDSENYQDQYSCITNEDITAQALIFLLGGFDTSSTLMSFLSYELAINPGIQNKLWREIQKVLVVEGDEVSYETLQSVKYLDMVVLECLRKWPPSVLASRVANRPFLVVPEEAEEAPLQLEKETICWIPIYAIHRDPKFHPNPNRFDPERFSGENRTNIKPNTFLPFGMGFRNCIGSRFALLKVKTVVFHLLSQFEIVPVEKTEIPLTLSRFGTNLSSANGFWLGLKPRTAGK